MESQSEYPAARVAAEGPPADWLEAPKPALNVRDVSLSFAGVQALSDVSFRVELGSVCGIIGPNGAGKSSLLNVISGLYRPTAGSVEIAGTQLTNSPEQVAKLGVARTFQNIALFQGMSVLENLISGQRLTRRASVLEQGFDLPRARREAEAQRALAEDILCFLKLDAYRSVPVGSLSYGLRKRVELGRALSARPSLLLLDEPMAGMNAAEKAEMSAFIEQTQRAHGLAVVLIEHDVGVVLRLTQQLVVLDHGQLIACGDPQKISQDPRVITAYLGNVQ